MLEAEEKAKLCAQVAYDAKAEDIVVLDLRGISQVTDFFVIASGDTPRMLRAVARTVLSELKTRKQAPLGTEGLDQADWILVDFNDVIVHLFHEKLREFYDLELLWGDAPSVPWKPRRSAAAGSTE